jgi:hypothetical protein
MMAYVKTNWTARQGTNLNKFTKSAETATTVNLTNTPDQVTSPGVPFSTDNMNHIEQGIYDAQQAADKALARATAGNLVFSAKNAAALAASRHLALEGQIIDVSISSPYYELGQSVSQGSGSGVFQINSNNTMLLPDARGMFIQGTGQQTRTVSWTDSQGNPHSIATTYDGKSIGTWQQDGIREIAGTFTALASSDGNPGVIGNGGALTYGQRGATTGTYSPTATTYPVYITAFSASLAAPTSSYNRPAGLGLQACISY